MIVIIDYGMGNLKSVHNALRYLNLPCKISKDIDEIKKADKLILPGVGAFKDAIDNINRNNLIEVIKEKVKDGTPLLGICLGMQMLFQRGYECEERKGLGFIKGDVKIIQPMEKVKLPHIGWNNLKINKDSKIIKDLPQLCYVYFVHSYAATDVDKSDVVAYCEYGGVEIPALVCKDNVFGAQFHPEKSGEFGLKILRNFGEVI